MGLVNFLSFVFVDLLLAVAAEGSRMTVSMLQGAIVGFVAVIASYGVAKGNIDISNYEPWRIAWEMAMIGMISTTKYRFIYKNPSVYMKSYFVKQNLIKQTALAGLIGSTTVAVLAGIDSSIGAITFVEGTLIAQHFYAEDWDSQENYIAKVLLEYIKRARYNKKDFQKKDLQDILIELRKWNQLLEAKIKAYEQAA